MSDIAADQTPRRNGLIGDTMNSVPPHMVWWGAISFSILVWTAIGLAIAYFN